MGWNYPDIYLEEMVNLIKGFVDILILASGYQSTGLVAHWNSDNVKNSLFMLELKYKLPLCSFF
ncbi:hypothetical protein LINPERHAP2_LOCUS6429, partial [Linum perenne]